MSTNDQLLEEQPQQQPPPPPQVQPVPVASNNKQQGSPDDEEDRLIAEPQQQPQSGGYQPGNQEEAIDPFEELIKRKDIIPLLAVLDKLDLTTVVQGKPLLNRLCTMHLPLSQLLENREITFTKDQDNRTALHQAIAADDVQSAYWCFKNRIENGRDNFGFSPLLQAIKHGRRSCFLLCLHYQFYDSLAPHICATYNRAWEIKVLQGMGMDVLHQRDSQHMTPLEVAVQNYSYDVAEFLTEAAGKVNQQELAAKTDSKGILRLVKRIEWENNFFNYAGLPAVYLFLNLTLLFIASMTDHFHSHQSTFSLAFMLILGLQVCLYLAPQTSAPNRQFPDILRLLQAPDFPPMPQFCPFCLVPAGRDEQHCWQCKTCVPRFHFHGTVCVNKQNQIFWFLGQLVWFWVVYSMHQVLYTSLQVHSLKILTFSSSILFGNAAIVDYLWASGDYFTLAIFVYLKIFLIYQFLCLFQWVYMLVLSRSYQEANHSERYTRLYKICRTSDGSYKSQEIRLMENGLCKGIVSALFNVFSYFFI